MLLEYWGQGLTMGKVTWERKQVKAYEGSHSPGGDSEGPVSDPRRRGGSWQHQRVRVVKPQTGSSALNRQSPVTSSAGSPREDAPT